MMKFNEYLFYSRFENGHRKFYLYNLKTKEKKRVWKDSLEDQCGSFPTIDWFFPEKQWICSENDIYDLKTETFREVLSSANVSKNIRFPWENISYSYTGTYVYYINQNDELTERDVETLKDTVLFDFKKSQFKRLDHIFLGPRSPDRKFIPILYGETMYDESVYLLNLETKEITFVAGRPWFPFSGRNPGLPFFWDKTSKYLIFYTDYNWFNIAYRYGDCSAYSLETKELRQLNEGFKTGNFWYSWE